MACTLQISSDSGVKIEQNVSITEKDKKHQQVLELHQRRERKLLELKKIREFQGSAATTQDTSRFQPRGDLLFDTKYGGYLARSDCMFIASVGSEHPAGTKVEYKPSQSYQDIKIHSSLSHTVTGLPHGTKVDLIIVSSLIMRNPRTDLVSINLDLPGTERSRDYYLQEMEKLMKECEKPGGEVVFIYNNTQLHLIDHH